MAKKSKLADAAMVMMSGPTSDVHLENDDCIDGCKVGDTCTCTVKMKLESAQESKGEPGMIGEGDVKEKSGKVRKTQRWKVIEVSTDDSDEEDKETKGFHKNGFGRGMM